jgi:uncharacterized protein (TIGR02246 family)
VRQDLIGLVCLDVRRQVISAAAAAPQLHIEAFQGVRRSGLTLSMVEVLPFVAMTELDRPKLDQWSTETDGAVDALLRSLQHGYDTGQADVYDALFATDILWGTPKGQVVRGFAHLNAIHRQMMGGRPVGRASRFEIVQTTSPAPAVVVTQIRRRALDGGFSETAMYVLVKRGGQWWVAAGQNTPMTDVLPGLHRTTN